MLDWHDLNARHTASFIWLSLALTLLFWRSANARGAFRNLVESVRSKPLLPVLAGFLAVAGVGTFSGFVLGNWVSYWVALPVATAAVWTLGSGLGLLLNYGAFIRKEATFSRTIARTLLPPAVITALVGSSTFSLPLELILVPVVIGLGLVHIVASSDAKHQRATYVTTTLLLLYALVLLALLIRDSISDLENLILASHAVILPVWLTVWAVAYLRLLMSIEKTGFVLSTRCKSIRASEYGDAWPLTVEKAWLCCKSSAVWVEVGKNRYPLNGTSKTVLPGYGLEFVELEEIWREDPAWESIREQLGESNQTPLRVNVGGLIREGLALEREG